MPFVNARYDPNVRDVGDPGKNDRKTLVIDRMNPCSQSNMMKSSLVSIIVTPMLVALMSCSSLSQLVAQDGSFVTSVERQPLVAATRRLVEALDFAGAPLPDELRGRIAAADQLLDDRDAVRELQATLDPLCLAVVHINAESRVKVTEGAVKKELLEQGWRAFLVKVHNEAGINPVLHVESPNALPVYQQGKGAREEPRTKEKLVNPEDVPDRFLDMNLVQREPLKEKALRPARRISNPVALQP